MHIHRLEMQAAAAVRERRLIDPIGLVRWNPSVRPHAGSMLLAAKTQNEDDDRDSRADELDRLADEVPGHVSTMLAAADAVSDVGCDT